MAPAAMKEWTLSYSVEARTGDWQPEPGQNRKKKFTVNKASTNRYKFSAIPYMQRLLNEKEKELQQVIGS